MFYTLRRRLTKSVNEIVYRMDYKDYRRAFDRLQLSAGSAVCVHSAIRNLGHLTDGPGGVVRALQDAVGDNGAVLMPTFPFGGTMQSYLAKNEPFDVRRTPSAVGFLTEYFRQQDDVLRSLHPTHAVAGWGARAAGFLQGHEQSPTPFGMQSPYGRLVEDDNGYMLMLGTRLLSLPHHIQERVSFPNLYLPGLQRAHYLDADGHTHSMETQVMRPKVPYFVAIPRPDGDDPSWCVVHDFCLLYPTSRRREIERSNVELGGHPQILARRRILEEKKILVTTRLGKGEIGLLNVKRFVSEVQPELEQMLARYAGHYDIENVIRSNGLSIS